MPEPTRSAPVADPDFPDLVGVVGGPMIPCKVVQITATMAPTERVEATGDLDAHYEQTQRYVIRYQPKPIEVTYMTGVRDEEFEAAKQAVLETAAEVAREQQTAGRQETCCVCGSPHVGYHNYKNQPFCRPCADAEPLLQVVHVARTEGPTSEVFAGPFTGDEAHAWIEANRTDQWTMCQVATLERPVEDVRADTELAEQLQREEQAEAEA